MSTEVLTLPAADCRIAGDAVAIPFNRWPLATDGVWRPRAQAETDETHRQIIPYGILVNQSGSVWSYARSGGDERLHGRYSLGVGGHVDRADAGNGLLDTVMRALRRELAEELHTAPAEPLPDPVAWLSETRTAIGRVHLGLLFLLPWTAAEPPRPRDGQGVTALGFLPPGAVRDDQRFELWSRLAAGFLLDSMP